AGRLHHSRSGQPGKEVIQDVLPHAIDQIPQPVEPAARLTAIVPAVVSAVVTTAVIGRNIHRHAHAGVVAVGENQIHGAGQALGDLDAYLRLPDQIGGVHDRRVDGGRADVLPTQSDLHLLRDGFAGGEGQRSEVDGDLLPRRVL